MKRVAVALACGFEEIEGATVVNILRMQGFPPWLLELRPVPQVFLERRAGLKRVPGVTRDTAKSSDFDMIVLPSGFQGTQALSLGASVAQLLRSS